ncbi:MAG: glutamate--tRNA ligase [Bacteroidia bacterium]
MSVVVRFAPSPTGPLHIGGVRTALYNYCLARKEGGRFILRIEDTDQNRYTPGAEEYILEALTWCGITFDEGPHLGGAQGPYRQSERKALYAPYAHQLVEMGWAYYAFDTEEELQLMREKFQQAGLAAPQYNAITRQYMKNSLTLPKSEVQARLKDTPYVIRFMMPRQLEVRFYDEIRGWISVHTSQLDDKILLKSDGMPTYHLANIVDDHLMGVTHVIRGEEWLPSTPLHVLMYKAFGWDAPKMAHLPLLLRPDGGGKLSKRDGDLLGFPVYPIAWTDPVTGEHTLGFRERGVLPQALVNYLALLGWHPSQDREVFSLEELVEAFSLHRVSKAGARFNYEKALWFNQYYLRKAPTDTLMPLYTEQVQKAGFTPPPPQTCIALLEIAKERATLLPELFEETRFYFEAPTFPLEENLHKKLHPLFLQHLATYIQGLSDTPWEPTALEAYTKNFLETHHIPLGKTLPTLRILLTGRSSGPPLFSLIYLLGLETTRQRLAYALQQLSRV